MDDFFLPGLPPVVQEAFKRLLNRGIRKRHLGQEIIELLEPEYGDNVNGQYVRWGNGLQVCWGTVMIPANAGYSVKTMPAAFNGEFSITITNVFWYGTNITWSISSATGSTVRVDARTLQGTSPTVDAYGRFIAIGRYK